MESSKIKNALIYGNSEVIYLTDGYWYLYTLRNNKLESAETFDSTNKYEVLKPVHQLDDSQSVSYTFVENNGKIGVTDNKGNTILNAEFDKNYSNKIYKLDDKYYFFLSKKGKKYLYNSEGKLIYEFKDYYEYSFSKYYDNFIMMNIENEVIKSLDFYDKNFKHIKNENLEKYDIKYSDVVENEYASDEYTPVYTTALNIISDNYNIAIFPLKDNKFLVIDKELNLREIENLSVEEFSEFNVLYYFKNYYVTYNDENNNITYDVYSYRGEPIVSNLTKVGGIYTSNGSLIVCKEENKCTIMNKYGKVITDYKYREWYNNLNPPAIILNNNSETYIYSMNEDVKDWSCDVMTKKDEYYDASYIDNDYLQLDFILYGKNCKEISGVANYSDLERYNDVLVGKKNNFLLIVKDNEIVYEGNEEIGDTKLIDNKFYFIMNSSLYYIEL